jgi:hypothetical protein
VRRALLPILAAIAAAVLSQPALAYFNGATTGGSAGAAKAVSVNQANVPTPTAGNGSVQVQWNASTLSNGAPVDGYVVTRLDAVTHIPQATGPGCNGVVTGTSCTELSVPFGIWTYTVTAAKGTNWRGATSAESGAVTVGNAQLTLTKTTLGLTDFGVGGASTTLTGSLTGFNPGEGLSFRLDSVTGTVLSGSPATANGSGNASVTITLPRPTDGSHTIFALGTGTVHSQASAPIVVDTVAPTTIASGADSAWHASAVSVGLSASDPAPATGVARITYQVDSGAQQTISGGTGTVVIPAPADHSNDGVHTLSFFATDNAGNAETPAKSVQVKIDTTPPATTDNSAAIGAAWFNTAKTVTLTPTDAGSGVAATYHTTDGTDPTTSSPTGTSVVLSTDGIYTVKYFSTDNVANQEAVRTAGTAIHIDRTAPSPGATATAGAYTAGGVTYIRQGQALTNTATDATVNGASSGVASVSYLYCAGSSCTPTTPIGTSTAGPDYSVAWSSQPADGVCTILARVTDVAGNTADAALIRRTVDNTPPATTDSSAAIGAAWFNTTKTVTLTPSDAGSGVAATYWTTDGTDPTTSSSTGTSVALAADGIYTVKYFSTDNLANRESVKTAGTAIHIDKTAPNPGTTTTSGQVFNNTYVRNGVTLQNQATDPTVNGASSGVASVAYLYCAGSSCTPSTSIGSSSSGPDYSVTWSSQPADGLYTILARVTDTAGNTAGATLITRRVDNTPPSTTDNSAAVGSAWSNTAKTVTLSPSDAGSGVDSTYYTTDGSAPTTSSSKGTSVALSSDGLYTVKYFSTDNLANQESVRTASTQIRIDTTAPTAPAPATGAASTYIKNGQALTDAATDPTVNGASSGVASVSYLYCAGSSCTPSTLIGSSTTGPDYSVAWSSQPADGAYTIAARATDTAGNSTLSTTITRTIDNTGPSISATLADAAVGIAGYIHPGGTFYVYANASDGGSGLSGTITANVSAQGGGSAVSLSSSGGPFTVLTSSGSTSYTYRSAQVTAGAAPGTGFSVTATDTVGNSTTSNGTITVDSGGKPGTPSSVTLTTGFAAASFSSCTQTANAFINAAHDDSETVTVVTAAGTPANALVTLTAGSVTATKVAAGGTQTLTFSGLNLSSLSDGTITLSATVTTPGGNNTSGAKSQAVTKLTATPSVSTAALTYTDNTGAAADRVAGANGAGPGNGYLAFVQTAGSHVNTTYLSPKTGGSGNFAAFNLGAETSTPTYRITAVDAACNQSSSVNWSPTDTK